MAGATWSGFFGAGVFYIFIDGEQVLQARYGYNGNRLRRQRGQAELFALIPTAYEQGDQRANACGVQEAYPVKIENDALRGFRSKLRQEFVDGLNAQFSIGRINRERFRAAGKFFNVESKWWHKRLNLSEI